MQVVSSAVHRRSPGNGRGAWKSVFAYRDLTGVEMIETYSDISGRDRYDDHVERFSSDNGATWERPRLVIPSVRDGDTVVRGSETFLDSDRVTGRVFRGYAHAIFHDDANETSVENSHGHSTLYVQYSLDGGQTFLPRMDLTAMAADSAVFARTRQGIEFHPILSCSQLETLADGTLLMPVVRWACMANGQWSAVMEGQPANSICMAMGRWNSDLTEMAWSFGDPIPVDTRQTITGLSEASIAPWDDGRLLAVARGDNGGDAAIDACKWWSLSDDQGRNWSPAKPLGDTQGQWVYSPATYARLLRHSSGRLLLITNLYDQPCRGGGPRHALHVAEVGTDEQGRPAIIRESILTVDERRDGEFEGLALSNFSVYEDRITRELCILCPRVFAHRPSLEDCDCMMYRVALR